ncbi:hypothetical protein [Streptomyces swartbergensis]|uniref:hypothetical protein n=1 Tax=Streptomyces swartbergensis TaxID=487165 RepID=UPI0037FBF7F6
MAAALDQPPPWEPTWKRPRTPKSKAEKKRELRKQRRRLQDAGRRRLAANQLELDRSLRRPTAVGDELPDGDGGDDLGDEIRRLQGEVAHLVDGQQETEP